MFLAQVFLIFPLTILHIFFAGFRSGESVSQSRTVMWWFGSSPGRCWVLLKKETWIFIKLITKWKHEVSTWKSPSRQLHWLWTNQLQNATWHPNHQRLQELNTALQTPWFLSFSTLPPDSRTLIPSQVISLSHDSIYVYWIRLRYMVFIQFVLAYIMKTEY